MRGQTACFTGHRVIPTERASEIASRLQATLVSLIERDGYRFFGAGGALGFDTMAANCVLKLREEYPHIKLILVLPCVSQADRWSDAAKAEYEEIKRKADKVVYTSQEYTRDCMFKRNRHLVDGSSLCVCYLTEKSGGTAYTVDYAQKSGLKIINIAM